MSEQVGKFLHQQLGNYTLTKVLGTGGFAEVYLGIHKHLETQAAIKVLQAQLNQADQENFLAEARTVARLKHSHIVHILEFGIESDTPYLVMNYASHGTLRRQFARGVPQPPEAFLPYLKQIASALQYAHDQHLIHRDIKPENMLLDENDEAFLSDFGIATQARSSRSQTVEEIIGTVVYMAPEQLQGKPRPASDQYSLAIVVYEWLCGTRPFQGDNYVAIATQHLKTPPKALREHVPTLSPAVEQVVLTALAKDYHQRYARVQDFADALELAHLSGRYRAPQDFAQEGASSFQPTPTPSTPFPQPGFQPASQPGLPPVSQPGFAPTMANAFPPTQYATPMQHTPPVATPPIYTSPIATSPSAWPSQSGEVSTSLGRPTLSRRALIGGGIAAALVVGGGITWWTVSRSAGQHTGANSGASSSTSTGANSSFKGIYLQQAKLIRVYKYKTAIPGVAWSKDSAYVLSIEDNTALHVWHATTGVDLWSAKLPQHSIPPTPQMFDWSSNGRDIAVTLVNSILIYDATTGNVRVTSSLQGIGVAWSPDGKYLALNAPDRNTEVALWDAVGSHAPTYTFAGADVPTVMAWKPDGTYLASCPSSPDGAFGSVDIWRANSNQTSSALNFVPKANGALSSISWSSSVDNYIATSNANSVEVWDAATAGQNYHKNYPQFGPPLSWSPDGRYLASASSSDNTIQIWSGTTAGIVSTCSGHTDTITALAWSRDGNYLASTSKDQSVRAWQVRQ